MLDWQDSSWSGILGRKSGLANLGIPLMGVQAVRQVTPGVTGLSRARVPIDPAVWYIAVGLGYPGGAWAAKGWVVHPLKTYTSWVQSVARQDGSISWNCRLLESKVPPVREEQGTGASGLPVVERQSPGSYALVDKTWKHLRSKQHSKLGNFGARIADPFNRAGV